MNADTLISMVLNEGKRPPIHTNLVKATPEAQAEFGIPERDRDIFTMRRPREYDRRVGVLVGKGTSKKVFRGDDLLPSQIAKGKTHLVQPNRKGHEVVILNTNPKNPFNSLPSVDGMSGLLNPKDSPWINEPFGPLPKSQKRQAHRDALIALGHHVRKQSLDKGRGFIGWRGLHKMSREDNTGYQKRLGFGKIDSDLHAEYDRLLKMEVERMIDHHNKRHVQRSREGLKPPEGFVPSLGTPVPSFTMPGKIALVPSNYVAPENSVYDRFGKEDDHDVLDHATVGALPTVHGEIQADLGRLFRSDLESSRAGLRTSTRTSPLIDKNDDGTRQNIHRKLHLLFMGMDAAGDINKHLKIGKHHFSPAMKSIPKTKEGALEMARKVRGI